MNIRNLISRYRPVIICVCVIGLVFAAIQISSIFSSGSSTGPKYAYYTTDGVTTFVDRYDLLPPFDHDGKPAYRIHMYLAYGKLVPGYMERYTPDAKILLEKAKGNDAEMAKLTLVWAGAKDVHAPGSVDDPWVPMHSPEAQKILILPSDDPATHQAFP